jgi:hypothetical protein
MLRGHCACGAVRYEVSASPLLETNCHCTICRRTSGAPFVTWFSVAETAFRITSGKPASFRSSDHGVRTFCAGCGTPLTFRSTEHPAGIDITTCTLDDPERVPPRDHTYTRSRLSWLQLGDELPVFPAQRS